MMVLMTVGNGYLTQSKVSQSVTFITCLQLQNKTLSGLLRLMFGSNTSLIYLFSWRLFRNRLPTKDNLITRGIIQAEANVCVGGCGFEESADHLFITCRHFSQLWTHICSSLDISSVNISATWDHYHPFGQLDGFARQAHLFLKIIWFACSWTIWKERKNWIFNNNYLELHQMLEKIKLLSFTWLKAKSIHFAYTYHEWWQHPLICMGIPL